MWTPLAPVPGSGRLQLDARILPLLGGTKGEEKGSKQPSVCQSLTHPRARRLALGSRKRQALHREPGLRPAGRPEAGSPGCSWAAQLLTRGQCATSVAGRSGPGTPTLQVVWTRAPGGRLSALSPASSFLLSRSEQHLGRDAPSEHMGQHKRPRRLTGETRARDARRSRAGSAPDGWMAAGRPACAHQGGSRERRGPVTRDGAEWGVHWLDGGGLASVRSAPTFICFIWQRTHGVQHREPTEGFFLWPCQLSEQTPRLEKLLHAPSTAEWGDALQTYADFLFNPTWTCDLKLAEDERELLPDTWRQLPQKHVRFPVRSVVNKILEAGTDGYL